MSCSKLLQPPQSRFTEFRRSSEPTMAARPRIRRIIHQLTEKGTARLIFDENCHTLRGVLINSTQDTISIYAKPMNVGDTLGLKLPSTSEQRQMQITIIDGESGEKYKIDGVTVQFSELVNPVTTATHLVANIDHPAIKFQTKEVLIGNRADVVISQFIDPKLSPGTPKKVLIGSMFLKVIAKEKQETVRRVSESVNLFGTEVLEQSSDFLA